MDFGKAFTFMFADPNWLRKLGIGTLVGLLGMVLMPILIGVDPTDHGHGIYPGRASQRG